MAERYAIQGQVSPAAVVTVYDADTLNLSSIYLAFSGGSVVGSSQVTADAYGKVVFYVDSATYPFPSRFDLTISKTGFSDVTVEDVWASFYGLSVVVTPTGGGGPTYGDLRPQIQRNWGRSDTQSQASILFYFNAAQRVLARAHNFLELQKSKSFAFAIGDDDYTITLAPISLTDLRQIYSFTYSNSSRGYVLEFCPPRKWDVEVAPSIPTAANSYPRLYTRWGNDLLIYPPPNEAFTAVLRYLAEPTLAVDTGTTIDFVGMDEVLVLLTTAFCFYSTEDIEMGNVYLKQGANMLKMYGIEAEFSKDFHLSLTSPSTKNVGGDSWLDPFVRR